MLTKQTNELLILNPDLTLFYAGRGRSGFEMSLGPVSNARAARVKSRDFFVMPSLLKISVVLLIDMQLSSQ